MNNDRFKFRIWDDKIKRYCACYSLDSDGVIWNGHTAIRLEDNKDIQVEFCTGIRDKNGKLIYEGDQLESHDMFDDLYVFNVEWFQGKMVLRSIPNSAPVLVWDSLSYEIIGNIHEDQKK